MVSNKKIAYLTATFPAISHTFILREIESVERACLRVFPVSVRQPSPDQLIGQSEKAMASRTHYLLRAAARPVSLLRAQVSGLRRPGRYFQALALALSIRPPGLRALFYQLIYFVEATLMAHHVRKTECDHIHNHFANSSATVAMIAAKLADVPFSFTLHGPSDLFDAAHWRLDRKIEAAEFVACISHFARSQAMLQVAPGHWNKLKIVHCGVEPELYFSDKTPSSSGASVTFVFVGRLAPVKGLRILMGAMPSILEQVPKLRLRIVGDGSDRAALERLAAPFEWAVRFEGPLPQAEVARVLAEADAMVLPSFAEGVPVVLMEAMASGKPVIATSVAGVSELVDHGKSGLLVAPGDADGLIDAMVALARDAQLRQQMGAAGREIVEAQFDIAAEGRWLVQMFQPPLPDGLRPPRDSLERRTPRPELTGR
jgi:glycosyltransferase involved in cell wall biosynthesis